MSGEHGTGEPERLARQPAEVPPAGTPPADVPPAEVPPADVPPAETPPAVYWRRRALALLVCAMVVALLAWAVRGALGG